MIFLQGLFKSPPKKKKMQEQTLIILNLDRNISLFLVFFFISLFLVFLLLKIGMFHIYQIVSLFKYAGVYAAGHK